MFFFTSSSSSFSPASFVVVRLPRVSVLANESPSGGKKIGRKAAVANQSGGETKKRRAPAKESK